MDIAKTKTARTTTLAAFFTLALTVLADTLFWNVPAGWTLGGFAVLSLVVFLCLNDNALESPGGKIVAALAGVQALLLIDNPDALSAALFAAALLALAVMSRGIVFTDAFSFTRPVLSLLFRATGRLFRDTRAARRGMNLPGYRARGGVSAVLRRWTLPVLLGLVFLVLFIYANPVMDDWFDGLHWWQYVPELSIARVVFWLLLAALLWSVLRPRLRGRGGDAPRAPAATGQTSIDWLFTADSVLRSLILFNLLFALQTSMDLAYLWGGASLPDGLSYAAYAHRGAYPLIVTALLAAAFVLAALRPGLEDPRTKKWMRALIYLWVAQNILLVVSCILRMDLYIEEYSLTYLRFAAIVWMGLVALGLCLIVVRMAADKSNRWLINANALALLMTLYICSALNIGGMIAHYNVRHNREIAGQGQSIDMAYLAGLGTDALPAIDWLLAQDKNPLFKDRLLGVREIARQDLKAQFTDWRTWTFRAWRQARAL